MGSCALGRTRPGEERGPWSQVIGSRSQALPSAPSAVACAAATAFAREYGAPWLYRVAALSSAGRVAARQHWVCDSVAGGLIGYASGSWLWRAQRDHGSASVSITAGLKDLSIAWRGS